MSSQRRSIHGQWSSRLIFILAVTGSAVGLGNIWKFPYLVGEHGGGAFVLVYLACMLIVGLPLLVAEIVIGRRGRCAPAGTMERVATEEGGARHWKYVGWLSLLAAFLVLSVYSVIGGWSLAYVFRTAGGVFSGADSFQAVLVFQELIGDPEKVLAWHTLFMAVTMTLVGRGVREGLEEAIRWFMPLLLLLLIFLAVYAAGTGQTREALAFLFYPDFSRISGGVVLVAMGHAFFTLSLGVGAVMVYGAYLHRRVSVLPVAGVIVGLDVVIALLAGLVIFPLVFAHGTPADSGLGLVFETMPLTFAQMDSGVWFGTLFFLLVLFAAWTSAISLLEPLVAHVVEHTKLDRSLATSYVGAAIWALGVVSILSFNLWEHVRPLGNVSGFEQSTLFDLFSFLAINVLLPISGLLIAFFAGWRLSKASVRVELGGEYGWRVWHFTIRFITPLAVLLVLLHSIRLI
ncbi:sodium-dependent transporter [Alkalilimnicola ehrlichii]|uniref:Transporter n=1 Tax=Alkalilimnicola ehrlichii TaxID=351052 RepID=A0A3E0WRQ2_9GAMM|nr:sodium-dependent transporter [Alkalilimnicola ehrlichii]RFA28230.1 sodium-dependent transporter [Alkalilimnicola ehrlichii]RFA34831.1 sodium-dependent transporter [Alkalilimnicola ehrlichii]